MGATGGMWNVLEKRRQCRLAGLYGCGSTTGPASASEAELSQTYRSPVGQPAGVSQIGFVLCIRRNGGVMGRGSRPS